MPGKGGSYSALVEERFLLNSTLSFFAGQKTTEDMLELIGASDERDVMGARFFGNFYLGLYYDSIGSLTIATPDRFLWP